MQKYTIPKFICNLYLFILGQAVWLKSRPIGLPDGDVTNIIYKSNRSKCSYIYLQHFVVRMLNKLIMLYLTIRTGYKFTGDTINNKVAPIFIYDSPGSDIKIHRDRDMFHKNVVPKYIAVLGLIDEYEGGEFFMNPTVKVSRDGKQVEEMSQHYTESHKIMKGEIIVIRNDYSAHGVRPLISGLRVTTGFRSI